MAGEITQTELQNAKTDAGTLAAAVNTNATITPRTGSAFSSIPKLVADKGADLDAETANAAAWATSLDVVADGLRGSRYYAQEAAASAAAIGERYIGEFASDAAAAAAASSTGTLAASDEYFNTADNRRRVYDGTNWYEPGAPDVTVSIVNGGTGATTAEGARAALKAVGVAATYAALTAIIASDRYDTMRVYVQGRAAESDGGEGVWRFDAGSSATANGGTVLAPDAGTGRWLREDYIYYTPEMFGAVGTLDDSATLTAALSAITAAGGGILGLSADSYFAKNLRPASNTTIIPLNGHKATLKLPAGSAVSDYIVFNANPAAFTDSNISLTDIVFDGNDQNDGFAQVRFDALLNFSRVTDLVLNRCEFKNTVYIGLAVAGCRNVQINDPYTDECGFRGASETATITIANPAVITIVGHGLPVNQGVKFSTTGALPTGITAGTNYYVKEVLSADTFTISATGGFVALGAAVVTSGTQSGVHTVTTYSSNGGPALFVSGQSTDQSQNVIIRRPRNNNAYWHHITVNAVNWQVVGGYSVQSFEAAIFSPNTGAGSNLNGCIIDYDAGEIGTKDVSGSAFELGCDGLVVKGCNSSGSTHHGAAFLNCQDVIHTGNSYKNFGKTSTGHGCLFLNVSGGTASDNLVSYGNTYDDDQGTVTGDAGVAILGTPDLTRVQIGEENFSNVDWVSGSDVIDTALGANSKVERLQKSGRMLAFTTAGASSYNKPFGLRGVTVEVIGGGGSGGGAEAGADNVSAAGGGGGGGYSRKYIAADDLAASETVTIAAGGAAPTAGNNDGNAGATSSFGSHCSATGGSAGQTSSQAAVVGVAGASAGTGSSGDVNAGGQPGGGTVATFAAGVILGGAGGASYLGGGSPARIGFGTTGAAGAAANTAGAGGSGGVAIDGSGAVTGGAGGAGVVIVTEHY